MKELIGFLIIVVGVVFGLYMGLWVFFIGGVIDIIQQIRAEDLNVMATAWGIVKCMSAGFVGWLSAIIFILPGVIIGDFN